MYSVAGHSPGVIFLPRGETRGRPGGNKEWTLTRLTGGKVKLQERSSPPGAVMADHRPGQRHTHRYIWPL